MKVELVTNEDLEIFRLRLIDDLRSLLTAAQKPAAQYLKSAEVRKLLKISAGTLQNLRITGVLSPVKIGGLFYYQRDDIEKLLTNKNQLK